MCSTLKVLDSHTYPPAPTAFRGSTSNFPTGADSSDEGAKIWFSGYYKCHKSPKNSPFTFRQGASMLRQGAIAP